MAPAFSSSFSGFSRRLVYILGLGVLSALMVYMLAEIHISGREQQSANLTLKAILHQQTLTRKAAELTFRLSYSRNEQQHRPLASRLRVVLTNWQPLPPAIRNEQVTEATTAEKSAGTADTSAKRHLYYQNLYAAAVAVANSPYRADLSPQLEVFEAQEPVYAKNLEGLYLMNEQRLHHNTARILAATYCLAVLLVLSLVCAALLLTGAAPSQSSHSVIKEEDPLPPVAEADHTCPGYPFSTRRSGHFGRRS